MTIWDEMSDAERKESLRHLGPQGVWAADALDARDKRIAELARIVYLFVEAEDDYRAKSINASQYNDRIRDWTQRAREALK